MEPEAWVFCRRRSLLLLSDCDNVSGQRYVEPRRQFRQGHARCQAAAAAIATSKVKVGTLLPISISSIDVIHVRRCFHSRRWATTAVCLSGLGTLPQCLRLVLQIQVSETAELGEMGNR